MDWADHLKRMDELGIPRKPAHLARSPRRSNLYTLYRWFGADGQLLYVGITENPAARFRDHERYSAWFRQVASCTVQHFDSRDDLKAAELEAIHTEKPTHNAVGNPNRRLKPGRKPSKIPKRQPAPAASPRSRSSRSVFGSDASSFRRPDAICDEE